MPRFFFNVHDGSLQSDEVGYELATIGDAHRVAVETMGSMMRDSPGQFAADGEWRMEVIDDRGMVMFALHSILVEAPASPAFRRRRPTNAG